MCGSNNCRKFGLYYHEKDDCCDVPDAMQTSTESNSLGFGKNVPLEPKPGEQRISKWKIHPFMLQVKDAPEGIITASGAALLTIPVTRARVTVTGLETGV